MTAFQPSRALARRLAAAGLASALLAAGASAWPADTAIPSTLATAITAGAPAAPPQPSGCASEAQATASGAAPAPPSPAQWWLASIALMVGIALRRTSA